MNIVAKISHEIRAMVRIYLIILPRRYRETKSI